MDFQLTTEQRMIRDLARDFTEREILPVAARLDREDKFPHDIHRRALELGLLHLTVPTAYGGGGLGVFELPS